MNIEQKAKLHLDFIEEFADDYQIKLNTNADAVFNWFMNNISKQDVKIENSAKETIVKYSFTILEKYKDLEDGSPNLHYNSAIKVCNTSTITEFLQSMQVNSKKEGLSIVDIDFEIVEPKEIADDHKQLKEDGWQEYLDSNDLTEATIQQINMIRSAYDYGWYYAYDLQSDDKRHTEIMSKLEELVKEKTE